MLGEGLREVSNPSEILISKSDQDLSGTSIAATLEGMRPLMIEIQALVSTAVYGTPQRSTTGYNAKRLNMLLAVLEKHAGFRLGAKDVFLNITGGITEGISGGIDAAMDGRNFWHGGRAVEENYVSFVNPGKQHNQFDCVTQNLEGYDKTYGIQRPTGYYDNLRNQYPLGVPTNNQIGYFKNAGYLTTPRVAPLYEGVAMNSIDNGSLLYLDTRTGVSKVIGGTTYKFNHGISITGYKQFDNGKILWQVFNPANGSITNRYSLPTINRIFYNVNHVSSFFANFPFL